MSCVADPLNLCRVLLIPSICAVIVAVARPVYLERRYGAFPASLFPQPQKVSQLSATSAARSVMRDHRLCQCQQRVSILSDCCSIVRAAGTGCNDERRVSGTAGTECNDERRICYRYYVDSADKSQLRRKIEKEMQKGVSMSLTPVSKSSVRTPRD